MNDNNFGDNMTTIYLIRHSVRIPSSRVEDIHSSQDKTTISEKICLSVEGEERARILCNKSIFDDVSAIYTSNCVRTMQTAKYLLERLDLTAHIDERLDERRTGKPNADIYPDWFERQYLDENFKTEGGESQKDVQKRFSTVIDEILNTYPNQTIGVFAHGLAITFYLLKYCKLEEIHDKQLKYSFNGNVIFDKCINAPEVFKLDFDGNTLINVQVLEFDDLPYRHGV